MAQGNRGMENQMTSKLHLECASELVYREGRETKLVFQLPKGIGDTNMGRPQ